MNENRIDYTLLDKVKNLININDDELKSIQAYITCVKLIGLDIDYKSESDLKKIVSGVSPNYENVVFLTKLIEHANLSEKLFNNASKIKNSSLVNLFSHKVTPIVKKDEIVENNIEFSCNYIECIPTVSANNDIIKDNSELFSFENLNLEDIQKLNNDESESKENLSNKEEMNLNENQKEEELTENTLNKKQIVDNEIINSIKIIENLIKNKKEIFKEKIRLFPPEINLREKKNYELLKLNCPPDTLKEIEKEHQRRKNDMIEKLKIYENNMVKVDKKLNKLKNKIKDNFEFMETEDYIRLKKNLIFFEKSIDCFLKNFNQLFAGDIKYIPQDKFSNLHLFVEEFDIKNEKLFNLGKSIEEVFSFISKLIQ